MIILDENFPESQRLLLKGWRIRIRQIGYEVGRKGLKDPEIIPLLLQLNRPTFFLLIQIFLNKNIVMLIIAWFFLMLINTRQLLLFAVF